MKKVNLSILYVILLSLLLGSIILLSKPTDKSKYNKPIDNLKVDNKNTYNEESVDVYKSDVVKKETIKVINNSTDIDLQAKLIEDTRGQVSLDFKYKQNGKTIMKIIDTSELPEIRNMFRFRLQNGKGYKISYMIINEKMKKLYFYVEGKKEGKYTHTAIYCYELVNEKMEKVIDDNGEFGMLLISPDSKYSAFSYVSSPQGITRNERSAVIILCCSDNKLVLNSNEDIVGETERTPLNIYSYDFIRWQNSSMCELRQIIKAKDESQKVSYKTILFNVNNSDHVY